jgi:CubicO group peptidase (beta-lactamase class C family)
MRRDTFVRIGWWFALALLAVPLLFRFHVLLNTAPRSLADVVEFIYDDGYYYLGIAANFAATGRSTLDGISITNGYQPLWLLCLTGLAKLVGTGTWRYFVAVCGLIFAVAIAAPLSAALWARPAWRIIAMCAAVGFAIVLIQQPNIFLQGLEPILFAPVLLPLVILIERGEFSRHWAWLSALLALSFLVRLDALSLCVAAVIVLGVAATARNRWFSAELPRRCLGIAGRLAVFVVPTVIAYCAVNLHYFGTAVPVSGLAKLIGGPKFSNWGVAWMFFDHWRSLALVVCMLLPLEWFARRFAEPEPVFYRSLAIVGLAMVMQCLYYCALSAWNVWPWYAYLISIAMALIIARTLYLASLLCEIRHVRVAAWAVTLLIAAWVSSRSLDFARKSLPPRQPSSLLTFNQASLKMLAGFFAQSPHTLVAMGDRAGGLAYWGRDRLSVVQTEGLTLDMDYIRARKANTAAQYLQERYPIDLLIVDREYIPVVPDANGESDFVVAEPIQGRVTTDPVAVFCFPQSAVRFRESYPAEVGSNLRMAFAFGGRVPCPERAMRLMRSVETGPGLRQFSLPTEYLPTTPNHMNKAREDRDRARARAIQGLKLTPPDAADLLPTPGPPVADTLAADPSAPLPLDARVQSKFAAVLRQAVDSGRNSAAVLVYVRDGKVRLAEAEGFEEPERRVPITTAQSRFAMASISKTFVGVSLAQLKARGQIAGYDDAANRYLTTYRLPDYDGHALTIKQLATHTAGLDDSSFGTHVRQLQPAEPTAGDYARHEPKFFRPPGEVFAYCNFGIEVLGLMIADISRLTYSKYIDTQILDPLGMHDTIVGYPAGGTIPHEVRPFEPWSGRIVKRTLYFAPMAYPAAGMFSTADDMGRYMLALLAREPLDRDAAQAPITAAMQDDMFRVQHQQTPMGGAHALLFEVGGTGSEGIVYHTGENEGTWCDLVLLPRDHAGLFFCLAGTPPGAGLPPDKQPILPAAVTRTLFETLGSQGNARPAAGGPAAGKIGWKAAWDAYLGVFVVTQRQHFGIGRLRSILHPPQIVRVEHGSNGLKIDGIDGLTELPHGVFQSPDGSEYFSFFNDPRSGHIMFNRSNEANAVYELPSAGENPPLVIRLLLLVIAIAATGVLWPLWRSARGARWAGAAAVMFGLSMVGGALTLGLHPFGDRYFFGIGWPILVMRICGFLVIPAALVLAVTAIGAWRTGSSGIATIARLHLLLLALGALLAVCVLIDVGVIGFITL